MSLIEAVNKPHYSRFKLQGKNRFLAKVHDNKEMQTASGLIVANTKATQDIPTTGEVIALSSYFGYDDEGNLIYPDVKVGSQIKVVMNSWSMFDCLGETLAVGDADYIIACYDPF